jgi:hypothetical protein
MLPLVEPGLPHAWLPDETLFSLCSRYHQASGNRLPATTCKAIFGHQLQGAAHDFPARLKHFVAAAAGKLGIAAEIVESRTLLPIYLRFAGPNVVAAVLRAAEEASSGALKFQLGLLTSRFRANHPLKACSACMAEDEQLHGTAYWRRSHQLPGVWVCLRHRQWLQTSDLKATGVLRFHWILPTQDMLSAHNELEPAGQVFALAEMVASVVARRGLSLDPRVLGLAYRRCLHAQGLTTGSAHRLKHAEAGRRYAQFLQGLPKTEQLGGVPASTAQASAEIARLIATVRGGTHPLRHMLLSTWLFGSFEEFLIRYMAASEPVESARGTVRLASADAGPSELDPRKVMLAQHVQAGKSVTRASREVGVDTNTGMAWAASLGITTPRRPKVLTAEIRAILTRLLARGVGKAQVAEAGKVSIQTITQMLRTEVGLHEVWQQAKFDRSRQQHRRRWLRLVTANPHSGVKAARLAEPAAYAWLYRNDRDWLHEQTMAMERVARSPPARVDWDLRDRQLSEQVRRLALDLYEAVPGRRIKLFQLYQRLPELKAKLFKMDCLPLTRAVLYDLLRKR